VFPAGDASLVIFLYCHSLVVMKISLSMTALYITRSSVFVTGNSCKCTVSEQKLGGTARGELLAQRTSVEIVLHEISITQYHAQHAATCAS